MLDGFDDGVTMPNTLRCWWIASVCLAAMVPALSFAQTDPIKAVATEGAPNGRGTEAFTKIANDGAELPASATMGKHADGWACTRDNTSGLTWEIKTVSGPRGRDHLYSWYNSKSAMNHGIAGKEDGGICETAGRCDTEKFVADVNAATLCGYSDWRMPTKDELMGISDYGRATGSGPAIDASYFPDRYKQYFWSGSSIGRSPSEAFRVTGLGLFSGSDKSNGHRVRLVRGGGK